MTYHPIEIEWRKLDPELGKADVSPCLDHWIRKICGAHDRREPLSLSASDVEALSHTLCAARARNERLAAERDAAKQEREWDARSYPAMNLDFVDSMYGWEG